MTPITITLNGKPRLVKPVHATYADLVRIAESDNLIKPAVDRATHPGYVFTITYDKGSADNKEGSIAKGDTLLLTEGMIINVGLTSGA